MTAPLFIYDNRKGRKLKEEIKSLCNLYKVCVNFFRFYIKMKKPRLSAGENYLQKGTNIRFGGTGVGISRIGWVPSGASIGTPGSKSTSL